MIRTENVRLTREQRKHLRGLAHEGHYLLTHFNNLSEAEGKALLLEILKRAIAISQGVTPS